ncbi:HD domain-containing phosphohydrolase [Sulfurospirillum arcachonense]|uniref:HD domain-containing phosphohydrolase n=1 Tax=Sulfurospirillum arcachonense TaxID=57666 RepID=UPI000469927B|nr:HD domain-containing phosphohydrolase [Sulfurospirillum arcachonense]
MRTSLRTILTVSFFFVIFVSISMILFTTYYSTKLSMSKQSYQIMKNISEFAIDKSKTYMNVATDVTLLTKNLQNKNILNSNNQEELMKYFYEQMIIHQYFSGIYYATSKGDFIMLLKNKIGFLKKSIKYNSNDKKVVSVTQKDKLMKIIEKKYLKNDKYNPRIRPWYKSAIKTKNLSWTEPYIFFTSKKPGITISTAIYDNLGKVKGVVGIDIEIDELANFINNLKVGENGKVFMINKSLKILSMPVDKNFEQNKLKTINDLSETSIIKKAYTELNKKTDIQSIQKEYFLTFEQKNNNYQAMFLPFNIGELKWIVGMYVLEDDFLGLLKHNNKLNILFILIIGCISLYISIRISKKISRPILKLRDMTSKLELLHLDESNINLSSITEIDELITSFKNMKINLRESYLDTLYRLAIAAEYKDSDTADHINRIGLYCETMGKKLDLPKEQIHILKHASAMHDIGKLGIPDKILLKPGKLDDKEMSIIQTHPIIGAKILKNPTSEIMKVGRDISLYHHEKWDGTGYPKGLKGEEIPLFVRIVSIVDVFDALMSKRCYKESYDAKTSKEIILEGRGNFFDPQIVDAFENCFDELVQILKSNT